MKLGKFSNSKCRHKCKSKLRFESQDSAQLEVKMTKRTSSQWDRVTLRAEWSKKVF